MSDYLTIKEAASVIGVTSQTLRNWEKKRVLVPYRNPVNNYRLYKMADVEHFIEKLRNDRLKNSKFRVQIKIFQN